MSGSLDQPISHEQPSHTGISDAINGMIEPIHRDIQRLAGRIFLPFVVFQLPDQIDRSFGDPHGIPFQDVNPGQD